MIDESIKTKIMENLRVLDIKDEKDRLSAINKILRPGPFYHSIYRRTERDVSTCSCHERWEDISENEQWYVCSVCEKIWDFYDFKDKSKEELKKIEGCKDCLSHPLWRLPEISYDLKKKIEEDFHDYGLIIVWYYLNLGKEKFDLDIAIQNYNKRYDKSDLWGVCQFWACDSNPVNIIIASSISLLVQEGKEVIYE